MAETLSQSVTKLLIPSPMRTPAVLGGGGGRGGGEGGELCVDVCVWEGDIKEQGYYNFCSARVREAVREQNVKGWKIQGIQ